MDRDHGMEGEAHLNERILRLVRESGRLGVTELYRALEGHSLHSVVMAINHLHQSRRVYLELGHDDYYVIAMDVTP